MKEYKIYYHKSPENKYYIGQTCQNLEERWKNGKGYHSIKFKKAIEQFGWNNFEHGLLEITTEEEVDEREAYYIELFDAVNNGYNTYKENYSGYHFSDLWQDPIIRTQMIQKLVQQRNTIEYKQKQAKMMSELWKTEEYREKQRDSWTEERKEELSKRTKENWKNDKYREKISKAQSEYRKKDWQDPAFRRKMCVQVQCVETGRIFESIKEAAEWCGVKSNTLCAALKSKTHQSGKHPESGQKLHWIRLDEVREEGCINESEQRRN